MVVKTLMLVSLWFAMFFSSVHTGAAADLSVTLDRNPVTVHASFTVVFEATGAVDADPDFAPLKQDFELLNQSKSSQVQFLNGGVSRTNRWSVVLMARRSGRLLLPAIAFGADHSKPVAVVVNEAEQLKPGEQEDIFIEVSIEPDTEVYVQQQLRYRVRLYRAVNIAQASLTEPVVEHAIIQKQGEDHSFETMYHGRRYAVTERKYVIFPQRSGTLIVPPLLFQAEVMQAAGYFAQTKKLHSRAVSIDVKSKAAEYPDASWLPAEEIILSELWPEGELVAGEAVTRTLTLQATGLTAAQLPEFELSLPEGLKSYPDQPVLRDSYGLEGAVGLRELKLAIIPTRAGDFTLPEISIPWWNIKEKRVEYAHIPARIIHVKSAVLTAPLVGQAEPLKAVGQSAPVREAVAPTVTTHGLWLWVAVGFAVVWILTIALWWRSSRKQESAAEVARKKSSEAISRKTALKRLKVACLANQSKEVEVALQICFDLAPGIREAAKNDPLFQRSFKELQSVLYSLDGGDWSGSQLWQSVEQLVKNIASGHTKEEHYLLPLNP